ncbi:MAG: TIGR00266 family protein [Clostridia bacterium]|nr:TIGR00266 family protein [Clostridia bacterium]
MKYQIIGQTVPVVEMKLNRGETIFTQSGGFAYSGDGLSMTTNARGGIMKGIGRLFSGESMFMANYTAERDDVTVAFASTVPGSVVPVDLREHPNGFIMQKGAFLCAEDSVNTEVTFSKKFAAGLFGGEGFILQKASGSGLMFLEIDGDVIQKELQPGEVLKVDTGNVVAFDSHVSYDIETVKGFKNIFLGGEGLFLTKLTGPGKVILQSQNLKDFAGKLIPFLPTRSSND